MEKNVIENGEQTCPMVCLVKDHKGWSYSPDTPVPPSKPVIAGNIGVNRGLSELLSLIIEPITTKMGGDSIDSTSDMLYQINSINESGVTKKSMEVSIQTLDDEIGFETSAPLITAESVPNETSQFITNRIEKMRNAMV